MTSLIRTKRLVLTGLVAAAAMAWPLAQASPANERKPQVPGAIAVPEGNKKFLEAHAVGVQIYSCNGTAWTLSGPRANLYDRRGRLLGTHFAGPTWQAKDGSKVIGARVNGVNVDPTAIDWLLLSKVTAEPGARKRDDLLADTTFIQRINTTGGLAPSAADCNASTIGTVTEVPYTADYVFFKAHHR